MVKKLALVACVGLCIGAATVKAASTALVGTLTKVETTSIEVGSEQSGKTSVALSSKTKFMRWDTTAYAWPGKVSPWNSPYITAKSLQVGWKVRVEMAASQASTAGTVWVQCGSACR